MTARQRGRHLDPQVALLGKRDIAHRLDRGGDDG
jgi:hypothetical protein